jgi:hypothetical protein
MSRLGGLPPEALDFLARTMARICEDPYDRLFSMVVCRTSGWPSWATPRAVV